MPLATSTDKNIVDKSRQPRNKAVSKTVRDTRTRLQSGFGGTSAFHREMLELYLHSVTQNALAVPVLLLTVAAMLGYVTKNIYVVSWLALSLAVHMVTVLMARRAARTELSPQRAIRWQFLFLAASMAMGVCWALFLKLECTTCNTTSFQLAQATALLIALATMAMGAMLLRGGLVAGFLPVVLMLLITALVDPTPANAILSGLVTLALAFLAFMTNRMHSANLRILAMQTEKDDLIAELEVAKSMSDEARRRAEEANLAKSRFLASMSHELRTPLNAILGFSEVMATEVLGPLNNPTYKEYADDIHRSGQHLLNLINEILDLSRIEAGRYELNEDALHLVEVAEDCIGMVQLKARSKNISIRQQFEENMPSVWADEKAIRQVTLNLLSNAVKFTPSGGQITVKAGWTATGGQYVSIRDNGPGIPEEEIPVVLSAFGQGSIAIKSAEQGTGLGLPIVQAILAKHEGQFILRSKLREGTEAIAILPAKRVLDAPRTAQSAPVERRQRARA
ncbi:two-component system, cell cycle sensor histidine kinase PleC [Rhizobium sp. RU20A]|uniref:sensor histidine kinase n=1 Tax=Rhizobium sp. RU20A TaxID=1907412 RepID=UPI000953D54C|nr:HAMP domain-containing sensor histidine kinase [Rhizobium sp. RU20A]SIQ14444.1 two-component system, cell cycle sensor histidine kinase PleC [Rhizobium sp. RU20A]